MTNKLNKFRKSKMLVLATLIAVSPIAGSTAFASTNVTPINTPNTVQITGIQTYANEADFGFVDNSDGTVTISSYTGTDKDVVIPATIGGKQVTSIQQNAFNSLALTGVEIPNGVTSIGEGAFENNALVTVVLPSTLVEIKNSAFLGNKIQSLVLPQGVTSIGVGAFEGNEIKDLLIPDSTLIISDRAFKNNSINVLTLGNSITDIGKGSFESNLITSVDFPKTLKSIGDTSFSNNKLTSVYVPTNIDTIGSFAFATNEIKTATVHEKFKSIIANIFQGNNTTKINEYPDGSDPGKDIGVSTPPVTTPPVVTPPVTTPPVGSNTGQNTLPLNLVGGALSLVKPTLSGDGFGNIKIEKQTVKSTLSFTSDLIISDARGTGEGWHLTVQATPFTEVPVAGGTPPTGGWYQLPKGSLTLSNISSISQLDDTGNYGKPSSGFIKSRTATNSLIDDGAVTIASAKQGEGQGVWGVKFPANAITLTVSPTTARVDKVNYPNSPTPYTSTVTWTLVSGPGN